MEQSTKINVFASSVEGEVLQCLGVLMRHGGTAVKKVGCVLYTWCMCVCVCVCV